MPSTPDAHRWFAAAAVAGVAHALPSLYWAMGGTALVSTLGGWAADWQREAPMQVMVLLLVIFVLKLAGAFVPLANQRGRLPAPGLWRTLSWVGAGVLVAYGAVNVVAAVAALTGVVETGPTMDTAALVGHAFLWDPLFLIWGLLLAIGLWRSRIRPSEASWRSAPFVGQQTR
ncbi:MAG: DUF3995 domain-containing protein [Humibacillus sp.]|nr:DUF3995 domain-containing protein [Humibacillus sp.]MDN5776779.1 DUF3995 domain-containing protein [Humibacillus sp.]